MVGAMELGSPSAAADSVSGSRVRLVATTLAGAAAVAAVRLVDPATSGWFPSCPTRLLTGVWCPGCGMTRAAHHLMHGDVGAALRFNVFVVPVLLAAVLLWVVESRRLFGRGSWRWVPPSGAVLAVIVALAAYAVLRNVPALGVLRGV